MTMYGENMERDMVQNYCKYTKVKHYFRRIVICDMETKEIIDLLVLVSSLPNASSIGIGVPTSHLLT